MQLLFDCRALAARNAETLLSEAYVGSGSWQNSVEIATESGAMAKKRENPFN